MSIFSKMLTSVVEIDIVSQYFQGELQLFKLKKIYTIRIVYKSGYYHDLDVTEFTITGGKYSWTVANEDRRPLLLGVDEIAAVFQLSSKYQRPWE
jgi:hypothetical protein